MGLGNAAYHCIGAIGATMILFAFCQVFFNVLTTTILGDGGIEYIQHTIPAMSISASFSSANYALAALILIVAVLNAKVEGALEAFNHALADKLQVRLQLIRDANPDYEKGLLGAGIGVAADYSKQGFK